MANVTYGNGDDVSPHELADFYDRVSHKIEAETQRIEAMLNKSLAFVSARLDGKLVGIARGLSDGIRGYFTECKLDPSLQGPAAVTKTDGRIEHDEHGIALEMARRVLEKLETSGVRRIDVLAYGTETDFLESLGFKKTGGLVGMTMRTNHN